MKGIRKHQKQTSPLLWAILFLSTFLVIGIMICVWMLPSEINSAQRAHGVIGKVQSMKEKLLLWLPNYQLDFVVAEDEKEPDWAIKFWTPIDIDVSHDSIVTLCKLNFKKYHDNPHMYAMFRDFVAESNCVGTNRKREKLSVLVKKSSNDTKLRLVQPTAFIFHESRVGSTLVANNLAADPWSMVFSESAPTANALLHCSKCTRVENIKLFQDIVALMGTSAYHKRLFFKFQSITTSKIDLALEAFPNTPWIFLYRHPVQTMMSHLDPRKNSAGAPCLRSMRNPPEEVKKSLIGIARPGEEAWCAAHLHMLCFNALRAYEQFSILADGKQRGILINYDSLPGIIPRIVLPFLGIVPGPSWILSMLKISQNYSKGKGSSKTFIEDSKDKEVRATAAIKKYADSILGDSYTRLESYGLKALQVIGVNLNITDGSVDWPKWKPLPSTLSTESIKVLNEAGRSGQDISSVKPLNLRDGRHSALEEIRYVPWSPFANSHNSEPIEVCTLSLLRLILT